MTVVEKLKAESMRLRKERSPTAASITFALSEIEKVGKNAGNRPTTDDEAIRVVQKLIATIDDNLKLDIEDSRRLALNHEKQILQSALPQMASADDIRSELRNAFASQSVHNKGEIMRWAKTHWGSRADMKTVGSIASELFGV
jgi:uncharacterized protein